MIGRKLGHYRILDRLATGGMGVVWLAEDDSLKRRVALKTLRDDLAASPERLARFEREAKAIAALNHPNIVTIHSIEEADGIRFLAMEYVEGKPLDEVIPAGGLPLPEFLRIAIPIADALAAAHARGITHRDLKPANVVVGDHGPVKILDFGLAKLQVADATAIYGHELQTTLTREGTVVGTLHYMSPEQLQLKQIDHRTDLFSLGIVLYEMATGDLPFRGESAAQVISSVLRDAPRRLDDLDQRLPPEIADLVAGCLEKEIGKRSGSAAVVRDRLMEVARQNETGAERATSTRLRHLAHRVRRRTNPLALAGAAALIAGLAFLPWMIGAWRGSAPSGPGAAAVPPAEPPAIAVLPLANFSNDPEYFVDGMTDGLIGSLARLGGVRVISRQSAMHYKGSDKRLPQIAAELGVDYIVEGSITRDGDRFRLQAQLVQPDPEHQVWADVFDSASTDVLALHNDIATAIADALHVRLTPKEESRMASTQSVDPEVYEAYLQGKHWAGKFREDDLRKARGYFERAIALDATFGPAWAGLSDTLLLMGLFHADTVSTISESEAAAQRALQVDPGLPEAHAVLANIAHARWDWKEAERQVRKALELDPNSAQAHRRYWLILAPQLRLEEGRREIETAKRLDPLSAHIASNVGFHYVFEERYADAEIELHRALDLDPDYALTHAWLWVLYSQAGRDPERGQALRKYIEAMGFSAVLEEFDRRLRTSGYGTALAWVANHLSDLEKGNSREVGFIAGLLAEAGETDKALEWLQLGVREHAWEMPWIGVAPDYRNLHRNPQFNSIIDEIGLPRPPA